MIIAKEIIASRYFQIEWGKVLKELNSEASKIIREQFCLNDNYYIRRELSIDGKTITYTVTDMNNNRVGKILFDLV